MPAGVGARRHDEKPCVRQMADGALQGSGFLRIALVVGGHDSQHGRPKSIETGRRIVVACGLVLVEQVVGVRVEASRPQDSQPPVGSLAVGRGLYDGQRAAIDATLKASPPARAAGGCSVYCPSCHCGSFRMASIHHAPHQPVAAQHRRGLRPERNERVHNIRMAHPPQPRVHAAHGRPSTTRSLCRPRPSVTSRCCASTMSSSP